MRRSFNVSIAVAVVAAYFKYQPPAAIDTMLTFLKNAAAPVALFTMGVTVALRPVKTVPWEMPALLFIKLVLHPVVVFVILSFLGPFNREWMMTAVLMAALPPALNVFVIANEFQLGNIGSCPGGGDYDHAPTIPPIGTLAMTCSLATSQGHVPSNYADW